jgi:hypothetical protein
MCHVFQAQKYEEDSGEVKYANSSTNFSVVSYLKTKIKKVAIFQTNNLRNTSVRLE